MVKENPTFDISKLTAEERLIREKDIQILFDGLKETNLKLSKEQCERLYDHMQQGAIEQGHSRWKFYQGGQMN